MCKLSIIVSVYNAEKYLYRCLESIRTQCFENFECILIDDGSTDRSGQICDEITTKDNRFEVIHNEHHGVSFSRNCGIENSIGEYIAFVDADDYIEKIHFSRMMSSDADLVFCGFIREGEDGSVYQEQNLKCEIYSNINDAYKGLRRVLGYTWSKIIKKDLLLENNIRFREDISFREDELFALECLSCANTVACSGDNSYHYVQYNTNNQLSKKIYDYNIFDIQLNLTLECENIMCSMGFCEDDVNEYVFSSCIKFCILKSITNELRRNKLDKKHIKMIFDDPRINKILSLYKPEYLPGADDDLRNEIEMILQRKSNKILRYYKRKRRREQILLMKVEIKTFIRKFIKNISERFIG